MGKAGMPMPRNRGPVENMISKMLHMEGSFAGPLTADAQWIPRFRYMGVVKRGKAIDERNRPTSVSYYEVCR